MKRKEMQRLQNEATDQAFREINERVTKLEKNLQQQINELSKRLSLAF